MSLSGFWGSGADVQGVDVGIWAFAAQPMHMAGTPRQIEWAFFLTEFSRPPNGVLQGFSFSIHKHEGLRVSNMKELSKAFAGSCFFKIGVLFLWCPYRTRPMQDLHKAFLTF